MSSRNQLACLRYPKEKYIINYEKLPHNIATYEYRVESLEEGQAVDEVKTFTSGRADAVDDEVDAVCITADLSVERPLRRDVKTSI